MDRAAIAVWQGSGKEGKGHLTTDSGTLSETQYSYSTRFESGKGTNPEELVAAAHAGCFCMKLSFCLGNIDFTPEELKCECTITMNDGVITNSHLALIAKVPGISEEDFQKQLEEAAGDCPISVLYNTDISVEYQLN